MKQLSKYTTRTFWGLHWVEMDGEAGERCFKDERRAWDAYWALTEDDDCDLARIFTPREGIIRFEDE